MNRQVLSRSERRMERKQVLIMLALVLAVALASFALGVVVGRNGATPPQVAREEAPALPQRLPVPRAVPEAPAVTDPGTTPPGGGTGGSLTFYENLPRGDQAPLGSGINLAPREQTELPPMPATPPAAAPTPAAASAQTPPPSPPAATATAKPARPAATEGSFILQVASFGQPDEAGILQARLVKKGLEAYVQQADLGSKGTWYRVFVGPLPNREAAEQVAVRLQAEEKLSPLVRKR
jgi:cell division septation protein DedD